MSQQKGFTLIEALISMTIFLVVLTAVLSTYDSARRIYTRGSRKVDIQMNARLALDSLSRQIRSAGYFPENETASTPLTDSIRIATNNAIAIYGDVDNTGTSQVTLFCLSGTDLRRTEGAVGTAASYVCANGDIVASSITGLSFVYYDANNNPIPSPPSTPYQLDSVSPGGVPSMTTTTQRAQVRRVVITLTTTAAAPPGQIASVYTLVSDVWRRNAS